MNLEIANLNEHIADAAEKAVTIRRQLHAWPELGREEVKTAGLIAESLASIGIIPQRPSKVLQTAVYGSICCSTGRENSKLVKEIVLRADMDALPIRELSTKRVTSKRDGYMHACGHDIHMAVVIGTASVISKIKDLIDVDVKFVFQPDEEGEGGARILIENGILQRSTREKQSAAEPVPGLENVDFALGMHVKPELPAGTVGLKYGKVHAASIMFQITVKGRAAHGARPSQGRDAAVAAAYIIANAQTVISRNLDPVHAGVISFGKINGGEAGNIIADNVVMEGILRGEDETMCLMLKTRLADIVSSTAHAMETEVEMEFRDGYPALINDDSVVNIVRGAIQEYNRGYALEYNCIKIREIDDYSLTVDDFACYLQQVPGAYIFLGSGYNGRENAGIHTGNFDPDEACIKTGIAALTATILSIACPKE